MSRRPSRRDVLRRATYAGAAAAVWGLDLFPARSALAATGPVAPQGTTLEETLLRGVRRTPAGGYARLLTGPGEPSLVRTDLGVRAQHGRAGRRRPLVAFAQLTDMHLIDVQSPARVEWADRYNDGATGAQLPFSAAYRPHEMLTVQ